MDHPQESNARAGVLAALVAAGDDPIAPSALASHVAHATGAGAAEEVAGTTHDPLAGRRAASLLYDLVVSVGARHRNSLPLESLALTTLGHWLTRRMIDHWTPSRESIARLKAALIRPDSSTARASTERSRKRGLSRARASVLEAIGCAPTAASKLGLRAPVKRASVSVGGMAAFNRKFRRRIHNLHEFATKNQMAGALGHGTLSAEGVKAAGRRLRDRVRAGNTDALHTCLQTVSHLPIETLQQTPVCLDGEPPNDALAWFDVKRRTFNYRLFHLLKAGARPQAGTEGCYEVTTQTVVISLSLFVADTLQDLATGKTVAVCTEGELVGPTDLHPHSSLEQDAGYSVTTRRLQESVPPLLLQRGMHRWPVALATNSQFLISRGRPAYSVCAARLVHAAVNEQYGLLNWPLAPPSVEGSALIGSFVTPTREAIRRVFQALADQADDRAANCGQLAPLVNDFNAHAAWVAALLALCLALRKSAGYAVAHSELLAGLAAHIDDKHVHKTKGPPVPIAAIVQPAFAAWLAYGWSIVGRLRALGSAQELDLASRLEIRLRDTSSSEAIFTIGPDLQLYAAATETWRAELPAHLKLVANFGRHFWPNQLMSLGVAQLVIDVLMRHQLDTQRATGSNNSRSRESVRQRLRSAIDAVLHELALKAPRAIRHSHDV